MIFSIVLFDFFHCKNTGHKLLHTPFTLLHVCNMLNFENRLVGTGEIFIANCVFLTCKHTNIPNIKANGEISNFWENWRLDSRRIDVSYSCSAGSETLKKWLWGIFCKVFGIFLQTDPHSLEGTFEFFMKYAVSKNNYLVECSGVRVL